MVEFRCPQCKGKITLIENKIKCPECNSSWNIKGDIPCFSEEEYYYGELPKEAMLKAIRIAEEKGWKAALYDFMKPNFPYAFRYAYDDSRADWRFYVPLSKESRVLDLGCGWGTLSLPLSKVCGEVVSNDLCYERVFFLNLIKKQEGIKNIYPFCSDILDLPFPDSHFDLVILNGVLEWVGSSHTAASPIEIQKTLLDRIYSILKPEGYLYIGIENRYGYVYFLGKPDDHTDLKFITLLPRSLANLYSKMVRKKDYRTYTHSYKGYKKLLNDAGFSDVEFYDPEPRYRDFKYFIPLHNSNAVSFYLGKLTSRPHKLKSRIFNLGLTLLVSSGLFKYFSPTYGIIAKK